MSKEEMEAIQRGQLNEYLLQFTRDDEEGSPGRADADVGNLQFERLGPKRDPSPSGDGIEDDID